MNESDDPGHVARAITEWFADDVPRRAPDSLLETVFATTIRDRRWRPFGLGGRGFGGRPVMVGFTVVVLTILVGLPLAWLRWDASSSVGTTSAVGLSVVTRASICTQALDLAATGDALWVACPSGLVRVAAVDGAASAPMPGIGSLAVGAAGAWALVSGGVAQIDEATRTVGVPAETGNASAVAVTDTIVWVLDPASRRLTGLDVRGPGPLAVVDAGVRPVDMVVTEGGLWPLDQGAGSVLRLDPVTGRETARLGVPRSATRLATGAGSVWVVDPGTGNVIRIEAKTDEPTAIPITPNDRGALTAAGAAGHVLYVTDRTTLIAIDVATGRRIGASPLPGYPIDMVVLSGDPWVLTADGSLTHLHQEGG